MSEVKSYSVESIALALAHHEARGAISDVEQPDDIKRKWRLKFPASVHVGGVGLVSLTTPQAYALCLGLRAGELVERRAIEALQQLTPPPCVDADDEPAVVELSNGMSVDVSDVPTRCGIHGTTIVDRRCVDCDSERAVRSVHDSIKAWLSDLREDVAEHGLTDEQDANLTELSQQIVLDMRATS